MFRISVRAPNVLGDRSYNIIALEPKESSAGLRTAMACPAKREQRLFGAGTTWRALGGGMTHTGPLSMCSVHSPQLRAKGRLKSRLTAATYESRGALARRLGEAALARRLRFLEAAGCSVRRVLRASGGSDAGTACSCPGGGGATRFATPGSLHSAEADGFSTTTGIATRSGEAKLSKRFRGIYDRMMFHRPAPSRRRTATEPILILMSTPFAPRLV